MKSKHLSHEITILKTMMLDPYLYTLTHVYSVLMSLSYDLQYMYPNPMRARNGIACMHLVLFRLDNKRIKGVWFSFVPQRKE